MSCPHQDIFSCESCIKEAVRANYDHSKPGIFERFRQSQARVRELEEKLALVDGTKGYVSIEWHQMRMREELFAYKREIAYLRHYGNKDCTAMADQAMEKGTMDE